MIDTQWPKFEVFLKPERSAPAEHAGSVHAADSEMALMNARDVFVRRPDCVQLGVAPSNCVTFKTAQGFEQPDAGGISETAGPERDYIVFAKIGHRGPLKELGSFKATSPEQALETARSNHGLDNPFWAAVPLDAITMNRAEDEELFFAPAREKTYKLHSQFPVNAMLRKLAKEKEENLEAGESPEKSQTL